MSANDIPCRVSIDLRQHQADQDRADSVIPYSATPPFRRVPQRIEGFSRNASDLFKIAVNVAGFPAGRLMIEIHKRAPVRATVATVEKSCGALLRDLGEDA